MLIQPPVIGMYIDNFLDGVLHVPFGWYERSSSPMVVCTSTTTERPSSATRELSTTRAL